jgi:amino acid adenylation domain-containing protein
VFDQESFGAALAREGERWTRRRLWTRSQTSYALALAARLEQGELVLDLEYDVTLFDPQTARRLLEEYQRLLIGLTEQPAADPLGLPMLDPVMEAELISAQVARERGTDAPTPTIRILEIAESRPDAVAIVEAEGASITYGELARRVRQLAATLVTSPSPTAPIAVFAPRSIDAIVALLAVHAAGAAFLPLDEAFPLARLEYLTRDAGVSTVLVTAATAGRVAAWAGLERRIDGAPAPAVPATLPGRPDPDAAAYVIYTSGSTGAPKGVVVQHSALANFTESAIATYGLGPQDRVLQFSALSVDFSMEEIFPTLAAGATLVLRNDAMARNVRTCLDTITRLNVTVADLPTAFWRLMVADPTAAAWPDSLRLVIVGGEQVSAGDLRLFRSGGTSHIRWMNGYGPTEATVTTTSYEDSGPLHETGVVPIGRPWPGVSHFVLDEQRRLVPPGGIGELYIGGATLARGYLDRPELTAERFPGHPFRPGARIYATGDLVRINARGDYVFVGRRDDQVKIRGFRVELGEVEALLTRHPRVAFATAMVDPGGRAGAELWAFVVPASGDLTIEELQDHLSRHAPEFMLPRLALIDSPPLTPGGKVDRRLLTSRIAATRSASPATTVTTDRIEARVQLIWSEILGKPGIDPAASFFDVGGHSLLMVQMLTLVEQRFNRTFDVKAFLGVPTIRHLATLIREGRDADWAAPIIQLASGRPTVPPLFLAPGISGWGLDYTHLVDALPLDVPVYALQSRGLRANDKPHASLAEAAEEYADLMRTVQPNGPYALAGYSAGGVVALAIAEVLHRRGERTDFVGFLDAEPPATLPVRSPFTHPRRFARLCASVWERNRALVERHGLRGWWSRVRHTAGRYPKLWRAGGRDDAQSVADLFVALDVTLSSEQQALMQQQLDVINAFTPGHEAIDVVLFRTAFDPIEGPHEEDFGWRRVLGGTLRIVAVPGAHEALLTRGGAPALAQQLEPFLLARALPAID